MTVFSLTMSKAKHAISKSLHQPPRPIGRYDSLVAMTIVFTAGLALPSMERLKAHWPKSRIPNLTHTPTGSLKTKPVPLGQSQTHRLHRFADRTACCHRPYRFDFLSHSCPYEEQRTEPTVNASKTTPDPPCGTGRLARKWRSAIERRSRLMATSACSRSRA